MVISYFCRHKQRVFSQLMHFSQKVLSGKVHGFIPLGTTFLSQRLVDLGLGLCDVGTGFWDING